MDSEPFAAVSNVLQNALDCSWKYETIEISGESVSWRAQPGNFLLHVPPLGDVFFQIDPTASGSRSFVTRMVRPSRKFCVWENDCPLAAHDMLRNPCLLRFDILSTVAPSFLLDVEADDIGKRRARTREFLGKVIDLTINLVAQEQPLLGIEHG